MALLVPLLCTLLLIGAQAQVFFNSSSNCTTGCNLNDPTIYIGYALPTPAQAVIFNVTDPNTLLVAPANSTYNVTELHVFGQSAALNIEASATISVVDHLYLSNVILIINETGALVGQTIDDEESETEAEFESSTIECYGHVELFQASFFLSYVTGYNGSHFNFSEFELENGTIDVWGGAQFTVLDESEFSYSKLHFDDAPALGEVDFETVDAYFPNGFYAENQYVISSSNFTAYFPDALSNVSFILAGQNNLSVSNLNFNSDKIKINNTGTPYITFNVNNNASFDGNLTVPGQIVVNSGSTVSFNGNISLSGGLTADVATTTRIRATGALSVGAAISFVGHNANNSFIVQDANITAPSINLDTFELRSYSGSTTINGNLINNGSLHIWESSTVIVEGNYTQHPNATFGVYNLNNNKDRPANLVVGGSAEINGELRFNTSETKKKFTAIVLQAASTITGNFTTTQFYGDVNEYKPQVSIVDSAVIISINPPSRPLAWQGLDWWVWLLVGVGALTLIITLVVIIRVVRNRSRYERVRGQY